MTAEGNSEPSNPKTPSMRYRMPSSADRYSPEIQTSPRRATDLIRASIRRGLIQDKGELSEDRLTRSLRMSRNSVRHALRTLAEEGILTRRRNLGTSVRSPIVQIGLGEMLPADAFTEEGRRAVMTEVIDERVVAAPAYVVERLGIRDERVRVLEYVVRYHDVPLCIRVAYVRETDPPKRYVGTVDSITTTFPVFFGSAIGQVDCAIEISHADLATSRLLEIDEGDATLLQEVLFRDVDGVARSLTYTSFRGELVTLAFLVDCVDTAEHYSRSAPAAG